MGCTDTGSDPWVGCTPRGSDQTRGWMHSQWFRALDGCTPCGADLGGCTHSTPDPGAVQTQGQGAPRTFHRAVQIQGPLCLLRQQVAPVSYTSTNLRLSCPEGATAPDLMLDPRPMHRHNSRCRKTRNSLWTTQHGQSKSVRTQQYEKNNFSRW